MVRFWRKGKGRQKGDECTEVAVVAPGTSKAHALNAALEHMQVVPKGLQRSHAQKEAYDQTAIFIVGITSSSLETQVEAAKRMAVWVSECFGIHADALGQEMRLNNGLAHVLKLMYSKKYKTASTPGESEGDFRARLQVLAHERRDIGLGKLRKKYDAKLAVQERKLLRARQKLETEQSQSDQSKIDTAVSIGSAILGAFLGRKRISVSSTSRIGSAIKRAGRIVS